MVTNEVDKGVTTIDVISTDSFFTDNIRDSLKVVGKVGFYFTVQIFHLKHCMYKTFKNTYM